MREICTSGSVRDGDGNAPIYSAMPRIIPEPRYFSIPSVVVGAVALRNEALNRTPCVRSLIQFPLAWTNSPAAIIAA
jgi:hypothetical protein